MLVVRRSLDVLLTDAAGAADAAAALAQTPLSRGNVVPLERRLRRRSQSVALRTDVPAYLRMALNISRR